METSVIWDTIALIMTGMCGTSRAALLYYMDALLFNIRCFMDYNMMTSSNGTFSALLAFYEWNPLVTDGFPGQRPVTRSFNAFLSAPEQTVEKTIKTPVIWDAIVFFMSEL